MRVRNSEKAIRLLRIALEFGFEKDDVIQTYMCARRLPGGYLCNTIVEIRLGDWISMELG